MSKSDLQYQIQKRETQDTAETDCWIQQLGLSFDYIHSVDIRLLQAQVAAHILLTESADLLSPEQRHLLETFQKQMSNKRSRNRLRPWAAYPILNISSKLRRKQWKKDRAFIKANNKGKRTGVL